MVLLGMGSDSTIRSVPWDQQLLVTGGDNPIIPLGFVVLSALLLLYTEMLATNK